MFSGWNQIQNRNDKNQSEVTCVNSDARRFSYPMNEKGDVLTWDEENFFTIGRKVLFILFKNLTVSVNVYLICKTLMNTDLSYKS